MDRSGSRSPASWAGAESHALIEQGDGTIITPKMNEVNVRTMEFCRRWAIADEVHRCPFPPDYPLDVAFVTTLSGHEIGRMPRPPRMSEQPEPHSPTRLQVCSQMWFDPILQRFARRFPHVRLHYRTRLESFAASENGVSAEVVEIESSQRRHIEADYIVGCDGANSMVRRSLSIGLDGKTLGHPVHLYFRAPNLLEMCGRKPTTFFITVDRGGVWSNVRVIDPVNAMWRLMVLDAGSALDAEAVDREAYLRRAVGRPLKVEWLGTSVWTRRSVVSQRYAKGRVFLAGDAVHQLSPTGALGMNTGIGDAVDLGWKLAAVLAGWGGTDLLSSYEIERRPIGAATTCFQATKSSGDRSGCETSAWLRNSIAIIKNGTMISPSSRTTAPWERRYGGAWAKRSCATSAACSVRLGFRSVIATRTHRSVSPMARHLTLMTRKFSCRRRGPVRARLMYG